MKSEKAKEFIDRCINNLTAELADHAKWQIRTAMTHTADLAEQEAEERMRAKAIKAHRACCPLNELQCIHRDRDDYTCTYDCRYVTSFIQKLSENEND